MTFKRVIFALILVFFALPTGVFASSITATSSIIVSAIVNASPVVEFIGGGGGGGGTENSIAIFRGLAYPNADIYLFAGGNLLNHAKANPDASFELYVYNIPPDSYKFEIYGITTQGDRGVTLALPINIYRNSNNVVSGIFLPPTIHLDKSEVAYGDILIVSGQTVPNSKVDILIEPSFDPGITFSRQTNSNNAGQYKYFFSTLGISQGNYFSRSKSTKDDMWSVYGNSNFFKIRERNIFATIIPSPGIIDVDIGGATTTDKLKYESGAPRGNYPGKLESIQIPIPDWLLFLITTASAIILIVIFL